MQNVNSIIFVAELFQVTSGVSPWTNRKRGIKMEIVEGKVGWTVSKGWHRVQISMTGFTLLMIPCSGDVHYLWPYSDLFGGKKHYLLTEEHRRSKKESVYGNGNGSRLYYHTPNEAHISVARQCSVRSLGDPERGLKQVASVGDSNPDLSQ